MQHIVDLEKMATDICIGCDGSSRRSSRSMKRRRPRLLQYDCDGKFCNNDAPSNCSRTICIDRTLWPHISNMIYTPLKGHGHRKSRIPKLSISCAHLISTIILLSTSSIIFAKSTAFIANQHHHTKYRNGQLLNQNRASLFISTQNNNNQSIRTGRNVMKDILSADIVSSHDEQPISTNPQLLINKLTSFSTNIQRYRNLQKRLTNSDDRKTNNDALVNAANSLYYFLQSETTKLSSSLTSTGVDTTSIELDKATIIEVQSIFEQTIIQSIRGTSSIQDFVLLIKLVYCAVDYATVFSKVAVRVDVVDNDQVDSDDEIQFVGFKDDQSSIDESTVEEGDGRDHTVVAILSPRIFGEAITSLSKISQVSLSKIKSLWNYYIYDVAGKNYEILSSSPSSYELNAMLNALGERRKVTAALKVYWQTCTNEEKGNGMCKIEGDAYTASILFGMLAESTSTSNVRPGGVGDNAGVEEVSPCWQWNEALSLLQTFSSSQLNNYAYSALLKVNLQASQKFRDTTSQERHNGVKYAMKVLEYMKANEISPDVITCSILLSTFDKSYNWKASVALLNAMKQSSSTDDDDGNSIKKWALPKPNKYTYSLVLSTLAKCNQGNMALRILNDMEEPTTWVYNTAMLACVESSTDAKNGARNLVIIFDILDKMESNGKKESSDAIPDTVTYNTALSGLDDASFEALKESSLVKKQQDDSRLSEHDNIYNIVLDILDAMEERGIARDAITYHNAIMACKSNSDDVLDILHRSLSDTSFIQGISETNIDNSKQLKGRASTGVVFVANAVLSAAATLGDIHAVPKVLSALSQVKDAYINAESIKYIIRTLGKVNECEGILALLICLRGQSFANDILKERYSIDILSAISSKSIPMIEEEVYSAAITSSLRNDALAVADQVLLSMKKNGLTLNQRSLKEIIAEYCRMAMVSSKEEFKVARIAKRQGTDTSQYGIVEPIYITSRARAKAALTMLKAVEQPPPSLLSPVAKACCAAGLWQDARSILRRMHRAAIREVRLGRGGGSSNSSIRVKGKFLDELPRLHRSLLKFCAKGGNITPALNFANDIQFLASQIQQHGKSQRQGLVVKGGEVEEPEFITLSSRLLMDTPTPDNMPESEFSDVGALSTILERPIGLTGQDWKLILIAASRGGHWKVCVATLPYIRPYVKETHPMYAREMSSDLSPSRPSLERLNRKYNRIARALTAAVLCFEARSQYAWSIRAIDDWIEWSGRRPRKEAVASACRVLAKRFRGQELIMMVTKVLNIPAHENDDAIQGQLGEDSEVSEYTYEKAVYTESINALHKNGLYEEADQLYAEGVASGHLSWAVMPSSGGGGDHKQLRLDLHGMSAAVAHSAVRVSLEKEIMGPAQMAQPDDNIRARDVMIVTGRGRRSGERYRPVLRPEVQRMLTEEFYPPLSTSSMPGNLGALLVPGEDIEAWLNYQQVQKGERLMFVADVLRGISSGSRIEQALQSSQSRLEKAIMMKLKTEEEDDDSSDDNDDIEQ